MGLERIPVRMICGLLEHGATRAEGLDAMLAALPGRETDLHRKWTEASAALGWRGRGAGRKEVETERLPRFDAASGVAVTASARLDGLDALGEALGLPRRDGAGLPDSRLILWRRALPRSPSAPPCKRGRRANIAYGATLRHPIPVLVVDTAPRRREPSGWYGSGASAPQGLSEVRT